MDMFLTVFLLIFCAAAMEPVVSLQSLKRSRDLETDWTKCIFCQSGTKHMSLTSISNVTLKRVQEVVSERVKYKDDHETLERLAMQDLNDVFSKRVIQYHKSCYSGFTTTTYVKRLKKKHDKRLSGESSTMLSAPTTPEPPRPVSRSLVSKFNSDLCIFCQEVKTNPQNRRKDMKLHDVSVKHVSTEILQAAQSDFVMRCRLSGYIDLIAADAKYHNSCKAAFFNRVKKADSQHASSSASQVSLLQVVDEIRCGFRHGEIYTLQEVWNRYTQLLISLGGDAGKYDHNKSKFKQRLAEQLQDEIEFVTQLDIHEPQLLFPSNSSGMVVQVLKKQLDNEKESAVENCLKPKDISDEETQLLLSLHHVALKVRSDIKSMAKYSNCGKICKDEASMLVPNSLNRLLQIMFTGTHVGEESEEANENVVSGKVLSVAQDIVSVVSKGAIVTPKHVGIGITIHQATRSKQLVDLLHAAGHSISYDKVRQVDTTLAKKELENFHSDGNVSIPSNIQPDQFFQFAADNIDIVEDTLDGKGTFHATQMVIYQRCSNLETNEDRPLQILQDKTLKVPPEFHEMQKAPPFKTGRPSPKFDENITDADFKITRNSRAEAKDFAHVISRIKGATNSEQVIPSWTPFNQLSTISTEPTTTIACLPIINAPAHENDTLWTVIMRALQISHIKNPRQSTVITFDEQLYSKAKELQWANMDVCKSLVLRLGNFHIILTYLKVLGKHFRDSGLEDVWTESLVYGENTAKNNMDGKSYNRAVRAHKLTFEALWRILWPKFKVWAAENEVVIPEDMDRTIECVQKGIGEKQDSTLQSENLDSFVTLILQGNLLHHIEDYVKTLSSQCVYWWKYIKMVSTLLQFIRAEREGNWSMHLSAFAAMLPWFAVYDHVNYTRWGTVYLADMKHLQSSHPDVHHAYCNGDFVVKKTNQAFTQLSTDQALEQVNRRCKVAGGLIGITRTDTARDRWCLTLNKRSRLADETFALFGIDDEDDDDDFSMTSHKEATPSRIRRDEEDIKKIEQQFIRFNIFDTSSSDLVCLSTKDVAPEEVKDALLTAEGNGKDRITKFVSERLSTASIDFFDPIKKLKSLTFNSMYLVPTPSAKATTAKKVIKADRKLFQRLLIAKDAGRNVNLQQIMTHELSNVPLSIAHPGGKLRTPTNKAQLSGILEQNTSLPNLPPSQLSTCVIIDGQALVQAIGKPKKASTFGDLGNAFVAAVFSNFKSIPHCTRVDVSFDRYVQNSIKGGTRMKRAGSKSRPIRRLISSSSVPLPDNWKSFIDLAENKANLTDFLSSYLMEKGRQLPMQHEVVTAGGFTNELQAESSRGRDMKKIESNQEEADTRIILHALEAKERGFERTIISCKDTDVLVLLIHFYNHLSDEVWMQTGTSKQRKHIPVHEIKLSESVVSNLPAFHAVTGCDTVSQFHGISKTSAWKVYQTQSSFLDGLGKEPLSAETTKNVAQFVCKLYVASTSISCTDDLRHKLFMKGKKDPEHLPPSSNALNLHIKRAHYQTLVWLNSTSPIANLPSPVDYGWNLDAISQILLPTLMTNDAVPKQCVELIFCGCKSCSSANCGCRSRGLQCTGSCSCSDSICRNLYNDAGE